MLHVVEIEGHIAAFPTSPLARWQGLAPWQLTGRSPDIVKALLDELAEADYLISGDIAVHRATIVEAGAVLKGPLIVGPGSFIAAGAYLRGGCWLGSNCTVGPGSELKSSFVFAGTTLAHFNFVGDSLLGEGVNLEAGSIVCNHRNERLDRRILIRSGPHLVDTGSEKFGALIGDRSRIGANAVIAPGALLRPSAIVHRTALCDQEIGAEPAEGACPDRPVPASPG